MALTQISDAGLKTPASDLQDNEKIILGTGNDLEIYHDGHSRIKNNTGALTILADDINISNAANNEQLATFTANGSCELFYDHSKKIETASWGVDVTGDCRASEFKLEDSDYLSIGSGNDLRLYHNGTNNYIDSLGSAIFYNRPDADWYVSDKTSNENRIKAIKDGAVELYHNGLKKFETYSGGSIVTGQLSTDAVSLGDSEKILVGVGDDLQIYHDGTTNRIDAVSGNLHIKGSNLSLKSYANETYLDATADGAVELYYDNVKKFETHTWGVKVLNDLVIPDNGIIRIGDATYGDIKIYHDGSHSYIDQAGTGNIHIRGNGSDDVKIQAKNGEQSIICNHDGNVELYYDDTLRAYTHTKGFIVKPYFRQSVDSSDSHWGVNTVNNWSLFHNNEASSTLVLENSHDSNPQGLYIAFTDDNPDDHTSWAIAFDDSTSTRFMVWSDGDVRNADNSYGATSDIKLKENIVDAGSQWNDVKAVKVRNFNYKTASASDKRLGVIAQEIETVSPGLVEDDPDFDRDKNPTGTTTKSVKYSILYMKAFKALQEAMAKIETLETKVAALEAA